MGMYDTIYTSKDLGPGMWNRELQTKDLDCVMLEYWLDPSGQLFEIDYSGTQDFLMDPEEDTPLWKGVKWIPNGNHGKVRPVSVTKVIEVYPTTWDCKYAPYPSLKLYLKDGVVQEIINETREIDLPITEESSY